MTERTLPAALPGTPRARRRVGPGEAASGKGREADPGATAAEMSVAAGAIAATSPLAGRAARLARRRGEPWLSSATRAGMLVGVSAAVYAVSLSTIAGLQAQTQLDAAARQGPAFDAVGRAKAGNDSLQAAVEAADARVRALATQYESVSSGVAGYQARLAELSQLVSLAEGSAAKLNANFTLPTVTMHGAISAGGVGGGGGSVAVTTTTTASGKP